jgi:hypothetical protein
MLKLLAGFCLPEWRLRYSQKSPNVNRWLRDGCGRADARDLRIPAHPPGIERGEPL